MLSEEQLREFGDKGYLVLPGVVPERLHVNIHHRIVLGFGSRLHCARVVLPAVHTQTDGSKATTWRFCSPHPPDTL